MNRASVLERLAAKILIGDGCWEWQASKRGNYGQFKINGTSKVAHRAVYEEVVGPIPAGLTLDHLCRNCGCVNPDHLEPVTMAENVRRGNAASALNARKTHCIHGHPLSGENLYLIKRGRACLTCKRAKQRKYRAENLDVYRKRDREAKRRKRLLRKEGT